MGCVSSKKKYLIQILEIGNGMIDLQTLEGIIIKTSFEEKEIFILLKKFLSLKPVDFKITNHQLMELDNFKHSPFGPHLLEAFGLKKITQPKRELNHQQLKNEEIIDEEQTNIENRNQIRQLRNDLSQDKQSINNNDHEDNQLALDVFTVPHMFSPSDDDVPSISFSMFCGVMKIFSQHATIDEKIKVFFNLYDFDNDGKITDRDLKQYFNNLRSIDGINIPKQEHVNENVIQIQHNAHTNENEHNNQNNNQLLVLHPQCVSQTEAPLGEVVSSEENKERDLNDNHNQNNNHIRDNISALHQPDLKKEKEVNKDSKQKKKKTHKDGQTDTEEINQIINLIIKETASNDRDYIDYLDFRNQMTNTQFLLDYNTYIDLKD